MKFIVITIIAGIVGFILSVSILFPPINLIPYKSETAFFELIIENKRDKVDSLLSKRIYYFSERTGSIRRDLESIFLKPTDKNFTPSYQIHQLTELNNKLKQTEGFLDTSIEARNLLRASNTEIDSSYYTNYFSIDQEYFYKALNNDNIDLKSIRFNIVDPVLLKTEKNYENIIKDTAFLVKSNAESKVVFINKYSSFGFWLVLSIIQMCMWFMIGAIIVLNTMDTLSDPIFKIKGHIWEILGYAVLVGLVLSIFIFLTYKILIDVYVIDNHLFFENFTNKMNIFAFIGYLIATITFFIYLLTAYQFHLIGPTTAGAIVNKLKETFDYSFAFSALILSIFVIWLGIMFNAINSLELMNYYNQISGKQYLNDNYVYLVGLIHTLLLLIFYIPVQLKIKSLEIVKQQQNANAGASPVSSNIFKNLFKTLSPTLITTSPLIASFFQDLVTNLLNN